MLKYLVEGCRMDIFDMVKLMWNETKLKQAFRSVKIDMEQIEGNHDQLKRSMNDWVIFLEQENRDLKARLIELENKFDSLKFKDGEIELAELSLLRDM